MSSLYGPALAVSLAAALSALYLWATARPVERRRPSPRARQKARIAP